MLIEGPLNISVENNDNGGHELRLEFTQEFKSLNLQKQSDSFHEFIHFLKTEISILEESDPNHQGMLTVLQIVKELLPHIESNEIPLEDAIIVNLQTNNPFGTINVT